MAQLAPIVLTYDNVDTSFSPRGGEPSGTATYVNTSGVPIGDKRITTTRYKTASGREKVTIKMTIPVMADATDTTGVVSKRIIRTAYVDVSFSFDSTSTVAERAQARLWLMDLVNDGQIYPLVDVLEYAY